MRQFALGAVLVALAAAAGVLAARELLRPAVSLRGASATVRGDATLRFATEGAARSVTVAVNGRAVPVARGPGGWQVGPLGLRSGRHEVRARVEGPLLFPSAEARWIVRADARPPRLRARAPQATGAARVRITVRGEPGARVAVRTARSLSRVRAAPVRPRRQPAAGEVVGADGRLTLRVPLRGGTNRLAVRATDAAGNATTRRLRVVRDARPPRLTLTMPQTSASASPTLRVRGRDRTPVSLSLRLGGRTLATARGERRPRLRAQAAGLPDGAHRIEVVARDRAGNGRRAARTLVVDTTETFGLATLAGGARGADVRALLRHLRRHASYDGPVTTRLGPRAVAAIRALQRRRGLAADGLAGPELRASLLRRLPAHVVIDRSERALTFLRGGVRVRTFPVAVGQARYPTPLGARRVTLKEVDPAWTPPDSPWAAELETIPPGPGNPLGTRWIGLGGAIGIHGTYAAGSIGTQASHGCIRMHIADAEWLYDELQVGTPVAIRA